MSDDKPSTTVPRTILNYEQLEKVMLDVWGMRCVPQTEIDDLERERDELKAELRKYEPSDGVMQQQLALNEAIAQAAELCLRIRSAETEHHAPWDEFDAWLALPVVKAARKPEVTPRGDDEEDEEAPLDLSNLGLVLDRMREVLRDNPRLGCAHPDPFVGPDGICKACGEQLKAT